MYRGVATFTLDTGRCPPWLFERMVKLSREMTRVLVEEYGPDEFIRRIADPVWFQSLGTVLAFDWNASGLTTTLTGALKEALRGQEREYGIFIAGGKGKTSRKTPEQIRSWGERLQMAPDYVFNLEYNSRMAAKVDSSLVQDGYQLYHHTFFFSGPPAGGGAWTVVQQGMNRNNRTARRYHWYSPDCSAMRSTTGRENEKTFVCEPHSGISSQRFGKRVLNLTSKNSTKNRGISTELANASKETLLKDLKLLSSYKTPVSRTATLKRGADTLKVAQFDGVEFHHHAVEMEAMSQSPYLAKILARVTAQKPQTYEQLVAIPGVGPKTIRALALVAEVIYGAQPSYEDPARYSFAHGGKDGTPYPVDRDAYDEVIAMLQGAVRRTRLAAKEKDKAIRKLSSQ